MSLKIVNLAPGQIYYHELGQGPDLLFLHGIIATSSAYLPLLKLLAKNFHIIAPIHPGHGHSVSMPDNWKTQNFVSFYLDFIYDLKIYPQVIIGHSFGGLITLLLANHFSKSKIIAMDCPCIPFQFQIKEYLKLMLAEATQVIKAKPDLQNIKDIVTASGTIFETVIKHPEDIPLLLKEAPLLDLRQEISEIKTSINLFWGEEDNIVPISIAQELKQIIPNVSLHFFPGKNHNYPVIDPEFTYNKILEIINL